MSITGYCKIRIYNQMSTTVGPASNIYCNTDGRWMSCSILNVNTHYRILSAHTLRSKADGIDTILEKLLHFAAFALSL